MRAAGYLRRRKVNVKSPYCRIARCSVKLPFELDRPIVFFDLETTGLSVVSDRIVEMAAVKVTPEGSQDERVRRFNPEMPIPPEATKVHKITDEDVADEPPFRSRAKSLAKFLGTCDLAGFNIRRYDLPLLMAEFRRAGVPFEVGDRRLVDVQIIFHREERRDLTAAAKFYLGSEHKDAHMALGDIRTTVAVLTAQLEKYEGLPRDINKLHGYCDEYAPFESEFDRWFSKAANGALVFRRGKHRGTPLDEVARITPDYLAWMIGLEDIDTEVLGAVKAAWGRHDPNQTALELPKEPEPTP